VNLKHRRHLAITTPRSLTLVILFPLLPPPSHPNSTYPITPYAPFLSFFLLSFLFRVSCPFVFLLSFSLSFIQTNKADSKGPADPEHFVVVSCISSRVSGQSYRELTDSSEGPRCLLFLIVWDFPPLPFHIFERCAVPRPSHQY
jgi:hypothetical protein